MTYINTFPLIQNADWDFEEQARKLLGGIVGVDIRHEGQCTNKNY